LDTLGYKEKLDEVDKAILVNADLLAQIVNEPEIFGHDLGEEEEDEGISDSSKFRYSHETGTSFCPLLGCSFPNL
jgi:carnosine N-methyltransferase